MILCAIYQDPPTGFLETLTGGFWAPVVYIYILYICMVPIDLSHSDFDHRFDPLTSVTPRHRVEPAVLDGSNASCGVDPGYPWGSGFGVVHGYPESPLRSYN